MTTELSQLELLASVDDLMARLETWAGEPSHWESVQGGKSLVRRLLSRVEPLRARVEAPLVVATFGGTGVGKSTLVNALVGADVTAAGKTRPTTTLPIVIAHPQTDLTEYGFAVRDRLLLKPRSVESIREALSSAEHQGSSANPVSDEAASQRETAAEVRLVRHESTLLRDIVLIDCPDPDTTEEETADSNLARLHRLLPLCDVLLHVSTQEKYLSAKVREELAQAASGCKLVFVQTRADRDSDIRDDWRRHLGEEHRAADIFFVDSLSALREQQQGLHPTGEFGRLIDLLHRELSAAQRVRIRRANLLGLARETVQRALDEVRKQEPAVEQLDAALTRQRQQTTDKMIGQLSEELLVSRGLWERRLLGQVTDLWGYSPFSSVLRLWHSQASLLASFSIMRARTTAQIALLGAVHGSRWFSSKQQELTADRRLEELSSFGLGESELREAQLVISGHVHAARLKLPATSDSREGGDSGLERLRSAAAATQNDFLSDAARRIDDLILQTAKRNSHWFTRFRYELLFAILPGFLLYRIGRNFFYDSFWLGKPHLDTHFYIPAALFLAIWAGLFVMAFTGRLRKGLTTRVRELARELATVKVGDGLFPELERHCRDFRHERERLSDLAAGIDLIRDRFVPMK